MLVAGHFDIIMPVVKVTVDLLLYPISVVIGGLCLQCDLCKHFICSVILVATAADEYFKKKLGYVG